MAKPLYNLVRNALIEIAAKSGILQPAKEWEEKQMLQTIEVLTKSINRATTYRQLRLLEFSAKDKLLWRFTDAEKEYNLIINHIKRRKLELFGLPQYNYN